MLRHCTVSANRECCSSSQSNRSEQSDGNLSECAELQSLFGPCPEWIFLSTDPVSHARRHRRVAIPPEATPFRMQLTNHVRAEDGRSEKLLLPIHRHVEVDVNVLHTGRAVHVRHDITFTDPLAFLHDKELAVESLQLMNHPPFTLIV